MALTLQLDICPSCRNNRLLAYDLTGGYDATSNPTGWGSPNAAIADVDTATLTFTNHEGTQYDPIDLLPTLPTVTTTTPFEILPADLEVSGVSQGLNLSGGIWIADYNVTGITGSTPFNYRARVLFSITCEVECCVDGKMSEVDPLCGCTSGYAKKSVQAMLALNAIDASMACGKISQARTLYDRLVAICDNNCRNC